MAQGLVEKVLVPSAKRKSTMVTCLRLLTPGEAPGTAATEQPESTTPDEGSVSSIA